MLCELWFRTKRNDSLKNVCSNWKKFSKKKVESVAAGRMFELNWIRHTHTLARYRACRRCLCFNFEKSKRQSHFMLFIVLCTCLCAFVHVTSPAFHYPPKIAHSITIEQGNIVIQLNYSGFPNSITRAQTQRQWKTKVKKEKLNEVTQF